MFWNNNCKYDYYSYDRKQHGGLIHGKNNKTVQVPFDRSDISYHLITQCHYTRIDCIDSDEDETACEIHQHEMKFNNNSTMDLLDHPGESKHRSKKVLMLTFGIIILLLIGILIAIIIIRDAKQIQFDNRTDTKPITLEDILKSKFYARGFNGTWISDTEIMYQDAIANNVILFNVVNHTKTILYSKDQNLLLEASTDSHLSPDRNYMLIERHPKKIYRHSYLAEYVILNLKTGELKQLLHNGTDTDFQIVIWTPINNSLIYVKDNNIYYIPNLEAIDKAISITQNGIFGIIYNGVPDWVYEEEVFSSNKALWFSPDGKKLAFATFNDSRTHVMPIMYYGLPGQLTFQYPLLQQIRYPKSGTTNPTVGLVVVDLEEIIRSGEINLKQLDPPNLLFQPIITAVAWANNNSLLTIWMNREQFEAEIINYDFEKSSSGEKVAILFAKVGWLDLFTPPLISSDGAHFVIIESQTADKSDMYSHVTMYERKVNGAKLALTQGKYTVTDILTWDEDKNFIYYLATTEEDPAVRHLFRVSTTKVQNNFNTECITCNMSSTLFNSLTDNFYNNEICHYNNAKFSKRNSYFVLSCMGPNVPISSVYKTDRSELIFIWEENVRVNKAILEVDMPKTKRFKVAVDNEMYAQVKLLVPKNFDTSGRTKYPLLVKVYAGPGSYQITEQYAVDWENYLVSNKNFIVAYIDGRGSGLKGDKMMFAISKQLGTVEIYDQINVTRYIQEQFPYIDANRTAIWGWSYGGYATGMALIMDRQNVFKCGISVAPVTDWALYDSIYTERYMGLPSPKKNLDGYIQSQLLNKIENLRNKTYFLVHGTMDDNVHYQQSMMLAKQLEQHDIMFRQLSYPDEDHGLAGVRRHLYHNLEDFLIKCFNLPTVNNKKR